MSAVTISVSVTCLPVSGSAAERWVLRMVKMAPISYTCHFYHCSISFVKLLQVDLNNCSDWRFLIFSGSQFHARGAATAKERSPKSPSSDSKFFTDISQDFWLHALTRHESLDRPWAVRSHTCPAPLKLWLDRSLVSAANWLFLWSEGYSIILVVYLKLSRAAGNIRIITTNPPIETPVLCW